MRTLSMKDCTVKFSEPDHREWCAYRLSYERDLGLCISAADRVDLLYVSTKIKQAGTTAISKRSSLLAAFQRWLFSPLAGEIHFQQ